jgi:hypothetical protein
MTPYEFLPPQSGFTDEDVEKLGAFLDGQDEIIAAYLAARRHPAIDGRPGGLHNELHFELAEPPLVGAASDELFIGVGLSMPLQGVSFTFPRKDILPAVREVGVCVWTRARETRRRSASTIPRIEIVWEQPELPADAIDGLRRIMARHAGVRRAYLVARREVRDGSECPSKLRLEVEGDASDAEAFRALSSALRADVEPLLLAHVSGFGVGISSSVVQDVVTERGLLVFDRGGAP